MRSGGLPIVCLLSACSILSGPDALRLSEAPEICDNDIDDNVDGRIDCRDPQCQAAPTCQESLAPACTDGLDNDADGRTDCEDPGCGLTEPCLLQVSIARDPACPIRESQTLSSDFRDIPPAPELWDLSGEGRARPLTKLNGLDLGTIPTSRASIRSRQPFHFGADYPAHLKLLAQQRDNLSVRGQFSLLISFIAEGAPEPEASFELRFNNLGDLAAETKNARLDAACRYRRQGSNEGEVVRSAAEAWSLDISIDRDTREAVLRVLTGTSSVELCRTSPLEASSGAPLLLRLEGLRQSSRDPTVLLETVDLRVVAEAKGCAGIREPLLAPANCVPPAWSQLDLRLRSDPPPRIIEHAGAFAVLAAAVDHQSELSIVDRLVALSSPDGQADFLPLGERGNAGELPLEVRTMWSDGSKLWVWATCPGCADAPHLYVGDVGAWEDRGPTNLAWQSFPGAVRRGSDALLEAIYPSPDGLELRTAVSVDGLIWDERVEPAFPPASELGWASEGFRGTAIAEGDGYTLLLYGGAAFGAADSIGLAISTDGVHFHPHPQNPVLAGEDIGLDEAGVHPVMAKLSPSALQVWYLGASRRPSPECARGGISSAGGGLYLANLVVIGGAP